MRLPALLGALAVLATALAFVSSPLLVPGFDGFEPDQFPIPQHDPPVQPAGYAFAIWGVIYAWLVASAAFGLAARANAPDWGEMRPYLALSLGVGAAWLPVAQVSPVLATVLIGLMLGLALAALRRAPRLDRWWARAPVGLYAGWLTAASAVALGLMLAGYGLLGGPAAAVICLLLAFGLAWWVLGRLPDCPEYAIGVAWALIGVAVANLGSHTGIMLLALAGAATLAGHALRSYLA